MEKLVAVTLHCTVNSASLEKDLVHSFGTGELASRSARVATLASMATLAGVATLALADVAVHSCSVRVANLVSLDCPRCLVSRDI